MSSRKPRRTAVILSPFGISPGHEGFLCLRHVAYVRSWARLRTQKRSDEEIDAGHVRDIASVASYTPLKITRPPCSSKVRKATWETPQSGLEISAGLRAFSLTSRITQRDGTTGRDAPRSRTLLYPGDRDRTGRLHRDVHGRPAACRNPGLPDDPGLASASRPRIARGPQAPGRQPGHPGARSPSPAASGRPGRAPV